jgi:hypothetical protein
MKATLKEIKSFVKDASSKQTTQSRKEKDLQKAQDRVS